MSNERNEFERIVNDYFVPYGRQLNNGDIEYVMEFLKILLTLRFSRRLRRR